MSLGDNSIYARSASRAERNFAEWKTRWVSRLGLTCANEDKLKNAFDDAYAMGERSGEQISRDEQRHEKRFGC